QPLIDQPFGFVPSLEDGSDHTMQDSHAFCAPVLESSGEPIHPIVSSGQSEDLRKNTPHELVSTLGESFGAHAPRLTHPRMIPAITGAITIRLNACFISTNLISRCRKRLTGLPVSHSRHLATTRQPGHGHDLSHELVCHELLERLANPHFHDFGLVCLELTIVLPEGGHVL